MTKATQLGLATILLLSTIVFSSAVASATDGMRPVPAQDGLRTASGGAQWTIVATYPIPEGASGLAYDGEFLYCGILGVNGGEVYQIDPANGNFTLLFTGPQEDAFGLTYDGTFLWTTDHAGLIADPAIAMQLDWSGNLISQFDLPDHYMSGIAYDNGDFWSARYFSDPSHIYKTDGSGTVLNDFQAPDNQPWDLCIENGNLWMADFWGDALYKINPTTGALLESHPSEGVDPAGIVWDGQFLWYCDNGEGFDQDILYKVDLQGSGASEIVVPVSSHDFGAITIGDSPTWNMTVQNVGTADLEISAVTFLPPDDLSITNALPIVIPASSSAQVGVVYAPDDFAPLDATATIFSNDPVHPEEQVTLTGHGVYSGPTINVITPTHNFSQVRVDASTRWFMEVRNDGDSMLTIDALVFDDPRFYLDDAVALPINLSTLASAEIGVWFSPPAVNFYLANLSVSNNDPASDPVNVLVGGTGQWAERPIGETLWSYLVDEDFDNSVKAIAAIPDISGDGDADVIVCTEDDFVRCFNGNANGTGDVLWEHEIFSGSVFSQNGLQITDDVDGDGFNDVVVGATGGARLIRLLSGKTGETIWTHDTHEYGSGGWVYQVDCSQDYDGDGLCDVLATTGDDSFDTGPKRVYCLSGASGVSIWETPLNGPGFSVIGVADFTGDGRPDAVAGASNEDETQGRAFGINGANGAIEWTFNAGGSSVWAVRQIDDITSDGIDDVMIGDFGGNIYGLDATTGAQIYSNGGYGLITRFTVLDDVNGDGHPDILPGHLGTTTRVADGQTGIPVWSVVLADKPASVGRIADVNGDDINDVVVGTLFSSNFVYFLDGTDGSTLQAINYGSALDAIGAIPDVVGDASWEMVAGGRNGLITCYSGGTAVFVYADVNGDGNADLDDLLCTLSGLSGIYDCAGVEFDDLDIAPCGGDGDVNLHDLLALLDMLGGSPLCP